MYQVCYILLLLNCMHIRQARTIRATMSGDGQHAPPFKGVCESVFFSIESRVFHTKHSSIRRSLEFWQKSGKKKIVFCQMVDVSSPDIFGYEHMTTLDTAPTHPQETFRADVLQYKGGTHKENCGSGRVSSRLYNNIFHNRRIARLLHPLPEVDKFSLEICIWQGVYPVIYVKVHIWHGCLP